MKYVADNGSFLEAILEGQPELTNGSYVELEVIAEGGASAKVFTGYLIKHFPNEFDDETKIVAYGEEYRFIDSRPILNLMDIRLPSLLSLLLPSSISLGEVDDIVISKFQMSGQTLREAFINLSKNYGLVWRMRNGAMDYFNRDKHPQYTLSNYLTKKTEKHDIYTRVEVYGKTTLDDDLVSKEWSTVNSTQTYMGFQRTFSSSSNDYRFYLDFEEEKDLLRRHKRLEITLNPKDVDWMELRLYDRYFNYIYKPLSKNPQSLSLTLNDFFTPEHQEIEGFDYQKVKRIEVLVHSDASESSVSISNTHFIKTVYGEATNLIGVYGERTYLYVSPTISTEEDANRIANQLLSDLQRDYQPITRVHLDDFLWTLVGENTDLGFIRSVSWKYSGYWETELEVET